ncbi:MAG: 50S ribosomal protein L22 [Alphaproteobacteria bacterium]|nr:50S ribosomal protein L22 [Alphaproteobacteria bacterium]
MKATLTNYAQSPKKVQLVINAIRGKKVSHALKVLPFIDKKSSAQIAKLIASAASNAGEKDPKTSNKIISHISVGSGRVIKKFMPRARGSAGRILRRSSNITVKLT